MELDSTIDIRGDLCRLAAFGANITDAHSCFVLLPESLFSESKLSSVHDSLLMVGYHSLSSSVLEDCRLEIGNGIIGWVAQNKQPIHVSPFEYDSRTLGVYRHDQYLKSFIAVPIKLDFVADTRIRGVSGVLACDSKKSYAFSKLQGKLLEDLSLEISNTLRLALISHNHSNEATSWYSFITSAENLIEELGKDSIDVLRAHPENLDEVEAQLGSEEYLDSMEQIYRSLKQSLPPNFPSFQMPNGDILLVLDNMMTVLYQNKIEALARHHIRSGEQDGVSLIISYYKQSFATRFNRSKTLVDLILATNASATEAVDSGRTKRSYVFGRA